MLEYITKVTKQKRKKKERKRKTILLQHWNELKVIAESSPQTKWKRSEYILHRLKYMIQRIWQWFKRIRYYLAQFQTQKMWLIFEIWHRCFESGNMSLQEQQQNLFEEREKPIHRQNKKSKFGIQFELKNRWPTNKRIWFTFHICCCCFLHVFNSHQIMRQNLLSLSKICLYIVANSNVMNLLLFFFLEPMTHF